MKSSQKIKIYFITGKGGVGKSTVAAAIALKKANEGKKTLLVELGNQSFYKDYFELSTLSYQPTNLRKNLDVALWSGPDCLREYARHLLKIESLYQLFFENPVTRALVNVAPALPELSILGKITSGPPRFVGPKLDYDCLVVDAYATGHFLALIKAPLGMSEVIRFGPMGEQSRAIQKVISDPEICKYFVVSIPEELPILEGLELSSGIENEVKFAPVQILNRMIPQIESVTEGTKEFLEFAAVTKERQSRAIADMAKYQKILLPQVFELEAWKVVEALAAEFTDV